MLAQRVSLAPNSVGRVQTELLSLVFVASLLCLDFQRLLPELGARPDRRRSIRAGSEWNCVGVTRRVITRRVITRRVTRLVALIFWFSSPATGLSEEPAPKRPNIVLIMADDMGYSDIGCYGGEIDTPNLDKLAAGGLRFTQFYNTARCCPTRASLLTGLYPHQAGMGWMTGTDLKYEGYRGDLNHRCVTIAEVLRESGYATYISGKWHVTLDQYHHGPNHSWPRQRGFDRFFGVVGGGASYFKPPTLTLDNERIEPPSSGFYFTDEISDYAVQFITDHRRSNPRKPFFLYVAYTAPHFPLHALQKDIDRYRGKYLKGWDVVREERFARMVELEIANPSWTLTPRDPWATAWDRVDAETQQVMDLKMAVYAAQVDNMDQGIGRIVTALKESGSFDDTLIFFLSDNGASEEGGPWGFDRTTGGVLGQASSFASYGLGCANVSDTPFRLYKHWVHEGGIATPMIVHWPDGLVGKGELRHQPSHLIDIMATSVDVAGAQYPTRYRGHEIQPMEGVSLVPAFEDKQLEREAIYWEHEGNRAVRVGPWKLVAKGKEGPWELYNMRKDRTETKNLAGLYPERAGRMAALWRRYAQRTNVLPLDERHWAERIGPNATFFQLSEATQFRLKYGDHLPRNGPVPNVAGKTITIRALIDARDGDGVLLAHGGQPDGYALFVRRGKLTLAVRRNGKLTTVMAEGKLPPKWIPVSARFHRSGKITLYVKGEETASGRVEGALTAVPLGGLEVGVDSGSRVGDYPAKNQFLGGLQDVVLTLGDS